MPLNKQLLSLPFSGGQDRATDARILPPAKLIALQNARFGPSNTIRKHGAFTTVNTTPRTGTFAGVRRLSKHGKGLFIEDDAGFFRLPDPSGKHITGSDNLGEFTRSTVQVRDAYGDAQPNTSGQYRYLTMASNGSLNVLVFHEGTAGTFTIRVETVQGALVASHTGVAMESARVVYDASTTTFRIFYLHAAGLRMRTITVAAPTTLTAAVVILATAPALLNELDAVYDAGTTSCFIVYLSNPFNIFQVVRYTGSSGAVSSAGGGGGALIYSAGLGIAVNGSTVMVVAGHTAGCNVFRTDTTLAGFFGPTSVSASTFVRRVAIMAYSNASLGSAFLVLHEDGPAATATSRRVIEYDYMSSAGASVASGTIRSCGLVSKPFLANGYPTPLVVAAYYSLTQPALFVFEVSGGRAPRSRLLTGESGGYQRSANDSNLHVTDVYVTGSGGEVRFPVLRRSARANYDSNATGDAAVVTLVNTDTSARPLQSVEFGGETFLAGTSPMAYDGVLMQESGFHIRPNEEVVSATDIGAGGGLLAAGTYQYCFTYEWFDSAGRRWQSAPSVPQSVAVAANGTIQYSVQGNALTTRSGMLIVVWRTEVGPGALFYRTAEVANDTTGALVTVNDNNPDVVLIGNEPLYTAGGELPRLPPPAHRLLCQHQERLFAAGCEDPYRIFYTDILEPGIGPAYREGQDLFVPPLHGEITALASMDDKLVVFCERGIWYFYGQGPNNLGVGDAYSFAQDIQAGFGCQLDSPSSAVVTPDGIWFRSQFGLRLLGRGLAVLRGSDGKYLGAENDELLSTTAVCSALRVPDDQAVRFYTPGTYCFLFDWQYGQWSVLTGHTSLDAIEVGGALYHLSANFLCRADESGDGTQAGSNFFMGLTTAWIKLSDLTGFQRIYEVQVLGSASADAAFTLACAFDYLDGIYVSSASYSAPDDGTLQARHRLAKQTCESVQFTILEVENSGAAPGFSFTGLGLLVGRKNGIFKLPSSRTF